MKYGLGPGNISKKGKKGNVYKDLVKEINTQNLIKKKENEIKRKKLKD